MPHSIPPHIPAAIRITRHGGSVDSVNNTIDKHLPNQVRQNNYLLMPSKQRAVRIRRLYGIPVRVNSIGMANNETTTLKNTAFDVSSNKRQWLPFNQNA